MFAMFFLSSVLFFSFLGLHLCHMEVPRLRVESELSLLAYTTATAIRDLSRICNLHHSSWQRQNLNPLREARGRTHILMDPSRVCYHWATAGTPPLFFLDISCLVNKMGCCEEERCNYICKKCFVSIKKNQCGFFFCFFFFGWSPSLFLPWYLS